MPRRSVTSCLQRIRQQPGWHNFPDDLPGSFIGNATKACPGGFGREILGAYLKLATAAPFDEAISSLQARHRAAGVEGRPRVNTIIHTEMAFQDAKSSGVQETVSNLQEAPHKLSNESERSWNTTQEASSNSLIASSSSSLQYCETHPDSKHTVI